MPRRDRARRDRLPDWDDGRTVADMNVEGMPWYTPKTSGAPDGQPGHKPDQMTRRELGMFTWGAVKAALLVVGVLCAFLVAFVLFCQHVWFH